MHEDLWCASCCVLNKLFPLSAEGARRKYELELCARLLRAGDEEESEERTDRKAKGEGLTIVAERDGDRVGADEGTVMIGKPSDNDQ